MTYAAGWNMPGYMPEMEPAEFDTPEEARDFICWELAYMRDQQWSEETAEDYQRAMDLVDTGTTSVYVGNLVYWVEPAYG